MRMLESLLPVHQGCHLPEQSSSQVRDVHGGAAMHAGCGGGQPSSVAVMLRVMLCVLHDTLKQEGADVREKLPVVHYTPLVCYDSASEHVPMHQMRNSALPPNVLNMALYVTTSRRFRCLATPNCTPCIVTYAAEHASSA